MARETRDTRDTGSRGKAKKQRVSLSHTQTEQFGLADNFDFTIMDAWYGPWQMKSKSGETYDPVMALWTEYRIEDEDKIHVEPVSLGRSALKYYAPSETGYEDEYAGDLSREDWLAIANGDIGNYELEELRGGHLLPISSRKSLPANSNNDFFMKTLIASAEANGVTLEWEDEEGARAIGDVLRGLQGHASRLKNDLQKDMDFGDGEPKKDRKVLVIVEVSGFEKGGGKKTGGNAGSKPAGGSRREKEQEETPRSSSRRRDREREEEPEEDTRRGRSDRGRRSAEEEEEETPRSGRESGRDSGSGRSSRGSGSKKPASGPDFAAIVKDRDFRDAYLDEVIEKVGSAKGKKLNRAALVEISDFEDQEWNETAFELATGDADWVIDWWEARREVDYDTEEGVVRLTK